MQLDESTGFVLKTDVVFTGNRAAFLLAIEALKVGVELIQEVTPEKPATVLLCMFYTPLFFGMALTELLLCIMPNRTPHKTT